MAMKMTKEQQQLATIFRFLHNVLSMSPVSKKKHSFYVEFLEVTYSRIPDVHLLISGIFLLYSNLCQKLSDLDSNFAP